MQGIKQITNAFFKLGEAFRIASRFLEDAGPEAGRALQILSGEIENARFYNPWFTPEFVRLSLQAWAEALQHKKIIKWLEKYPASDRPSAEGKKVAIIMAGNLPMVGLHDLLCVIASGNRAIVKPSSQDNRLIPAVKELINEIDPVLGERIEIREDILKGFDAIIATGSNNTSRYFEYYFGKYPSIIRKHRNSAAVITGKETAKELKGLAQDVFTYFGMGCRNVSKLYIPEDYDPERLFPAFQDFEYFANHNKYRNNYEYQKSIFIINKISHFDNGFLLLRQDESLTSPVSVLNFERYRQLDSLVEQLGNLKGSLQCIISGDKSIPGSILPGTGQFPELWDYADGIDTLEFLLNMK